MSTSVIMRTMPPHAPIADNPSSNSTNTSPTNAKPKHKRSQSENYAQQRRQYIHRIYTNNNTNNTSPTSPSYPATKILSSSSTENAASESFILDSHSPLFGSLNKITITRPKSGNNTPNHAYTYKAIGNASESVEDLMENSQNNEEMKFEDLRNELQELQRKRSNIQQNVHIIPPKKMKKKATQKELQLVLDHYKIAKEKDIEAILFKHEPHVMYYRDKLYNEAKESGINAQSNDYIRLKILGAVIEFTYMNIEPPNEYTKQTDRKHFKEVGAWAAKFAKNKGIIPPVTLIYSAWCHDIERFIPSTKCEYLPEAVDKYRKQIIHGITSAKVAVCLLKGAPVSEQEKQRIYQMVLYHDVPHPREDIQILGETLIHAAPQHLMDELGLLMDADSFAFFQSTIYFFILFKSKKNSPDWIWERVCNNIKRLRPYLRERAVRCINKLPDHLLNKMSINYKELTHLCSESGIHSPANEQITSRTISPNIDNIKMNHEPNNELFINELQINESSNSTSDSTEFANEYGK